MHHQHSWRLAALLIALSAAAFPASAQSQSIRIGKSGQIELGQETRLGKALLGPGHYEVQHAVIDGQHYVVVRERLRPTRRHRAFITGSEVARVPCRIVTLDKPPRSSSVYWTRGPDGYATITEIRIADEPAGHIIALEPSGGH